MITVLKLTEATEQGIEDINRLLGQLRENSTEPKGSISDLKKITDDQNVALVVAQDGERTIGMATLYMVTKFGKRVGYVEDVVVDAAYRGKGLGEKIMQTLVDTARAGGVTTLYLTSRIERVAGNNLYQKLGFEIKETNVYRMKL